MNTFRGHLQFATLGDFDGLGGLIARLRLGLLDLLNNVVALEDFAEDDVAVVEPGCGREGYEELYGDDASASHCSSKRLNEKRWCGIQRAGARVSLMWKSGRTPAHR